MEMAPADASARGASSAPDDMSSKRPAPASPPVAALNASPPNSPPAKSAKGPDAATPEPARSLAGAFAAASRAPLPDPSGLPRLRVFAPPGQPSAPSSGATADQEPCTGLPEGPPSLFARLECLDAEEDDAQADADFFSTLSGGSTTNVTFVAAPVDGFFVPDDDNLMREAENYFKAVAADNKCVVNALRVPILVGEKACVAITITTGAVNEAKYFVQENSKSPFALTGSQYLAFPSIQDYIDHASSRVDLDAKPSFVLMLTGLPCVRNNTLLAYKKYLEECAFKLRDGYVLSLVSLDKKMCGVHTPYKAGTLIIKVVVPDALHLRALRATPVPAIVDGKSAGYYLSTRIGNIKILEVHGEKVESLSCCGVLQGAPHRHSDCIKFLANRHARVGIVKKFAPMRAHKKEVSAKASTFLNASNELGKLAMRGGYEKCNRFFNSGFCSFDKGRGCSRFPCGYRTKYDTVRCILATLE